MVAIEVTVVVAVVARVTSALIKVRGRVVARVTSALIRNRESAQSAVDARFVT